MVNGVKRARSATATITHMFINEVPIDGYATTGITADEIHASVPLAGLTLESDQSGSVTVYISSGDTNLSAGTTINVKLHSAGGMDYIKLIRLT